MSDRVVHPDRSWCPSCNGFLLGGEHFDGRRCGTCHGETVPAHWEISADGKTGYFVLKVPGVVRSVSYSVTFGTHGEPTPKDPQKPR